MRATKPPIQWVPDGLSLGVKRLVNEADNSPQSSAEVKNAGAIPPLHDTSSWQCLIKHMDNFTFTYITPLIVHVQISSPHVIITR